MDVNAIRYRLSVNSGSKNRLIEWLHSTRLDQLPGWFVTGTDTGVGKTYVGVRLLASLRALGRAVTVRKPVESGWVAQIEQTDAWQLARAAGDLPLAAVCPYRFSAALAPPRAAALQGQTVTLAQLRAVCPEVGASRAFVHVEGAGGFYSPLAADGLNADLAQCLGLPVLLVAADRLGCLNHVLLVAEAVQARGLTLAAVILNPLPDYSVPTGMDNLADLQGYLDVPLLRLPG
ncbi:MAG: dethiobiotin synthase [Thiothrix sp.]